MRWIVSLCLLVNLLPWQPAQTDFAPLEHDLQAALQAEGIPGVVVMLVQGDEVVYLKGIGQAANGQPLDPQAHYSLGRASEPFLTTLAFLQAEQRRLAPDLPLTNLLPGFSLPDRPNATDATTVARLLTHTAGFGRDEQASLTALPLSADIPSEFFPGARYSYCSLCTRLLVTLLEHLTQQPLPELMYNEVFYPLRMDDSTIEDGQLYTTPNDLAHFMSVHLQKGRWEGVQLIKPESIAAMHRPDQPTQRTPREFAGDGWLVTVENGLTVLTQPEDHILTARDVGNYQAQLTLIPAYQRGAVLLTDQPTPGLDLLMEVVLKHFAGWTPPTPLPLERPSLLAGTFVAEDGTSLTLETVEDGLTITYAGVTVSTQQADTRTLEFELNGTPAYLYFPENGRPRSAIFTQGWVTTPFTRQN